jgi:hypothetical protein
MITLSWYYDNMLSCFFFLKTSHPGEKTKYKIGGEISPVSIYLITKIFSPFLAVHWGDGLLDEQKVKISTNTVHFLRVNKVFNK